MSGYTTTRGFVRLTLACENPFLAINGVKA
jgi:hypothetical protein